MKTKLLVPFVFVFCLIFFFKAFFLNGLLPIPSDLLVGLFHPFRDVYSEEYPRGVPFKNFLLTDPITQQIPWRDLSFEEIRSGRLPLWNPYQMAGYPLLANIQSAPFYPINILFLILPFTLGWSILIFSQPLIAMIGMYLFLRQEKISKEGSIFASIAFAFSGFMVAWLEWGTIGSTAAWMPLMLYFSSKAFIEKKKLFPSVLLSLTVITAFLAGHTQTFFYEMVILVAYMIFSMTVRRDGIKSMIPAFAALCFAGLIVLPLIIVQFQFISLSGRMVDLDWHASGWFIPWQNMIQFIAPNFFGNPATGNYWGVWNYSEFLGYIGIVPLIFAILALLFVRKRQIFFFGLATILGIVLAFPTMVALLPFQFNIPFLSTAQPTRILFMIDFALVVLAAYGFDAFKKMSKIHLLIPASMILSLGLIYMISKSMIDGGSLALENWLVAQRNLILPGGFVLLSFSIFLANIFIPRLRKLLPIFIIVITVIDLFLVMQKYTPFTSSQYFYPEVKLLTFLKDESGINRVMSLDRRILHPNIATKYRIQMIEGYDPLYLLRYGELLAASNRQKPDIAPPFGFSRILTTDRYVSPIINLLGVKYILSLNEINDPNLKEVYAQGQTKVYQNMLALPRTFFAAQVSTVTSKEGSIDFLFKEKNLLESAVVETTQTISGEYAKGKVEVLSYEPNRVELKTSNKGEGFLVLTDSFYPTWKAYIDGESSQLFLVDFSFRGVIVPQGDHHVEFINTAFAK